MTVISVISTVKNGENTIGETIKSLLAQSYSNWELVIIDDGSTDSTNEIIKKFMKYDERIKLIETKGIGRGRALNLAVSKAEAKYIANIDADDLYHPKKLEIQLEYLKNYPQFFLISTNINIIYANEKSEWGKIDIENVEVEDITVRNFKKNLVDHSSIICKKEKLIEIGGYNEKRKSQFDYELWLRAAYLNEKIGKINLKLVSKRIHENQSFERKRFKHLLRSITLQIQYIIKDKKLHLIFYPVGRLFLGIFPFKIRRFLNKLIRI